MLPALPIKRRGFKHNNNKMTPLCTLSLALPTAHRTCPPWVWFHIKALHLCGNRREGAERAGYSSSNTSMFTSLGESQPWEGLLLQPPQEQTTASPRWRSSGLAPARQQPAQDLNVRPASSSIFTDEGIFLSTETALVLTPAENTGMARVNVNNLLSAKTANVTLSLLRPWG